MDTLKIERDARVLDGEREVGRVTHVIVDPQTKEITQVVVAHDDRESTIPIAAVAAAGGGMVRLRDGMGATFRDGFARDAFHGLDERTAGAENAGIATHGGAPLREAETDAVIVERPAATARAVEHTAAADAPAAATGRDDAIHVPVAEERLAVGKRAVELGEATIRKTVTEEQQTVPVTLVNEEVRVEERDVADRRATGTEDLFKEETIRVALRGEEAVVAKEAVVTGEVVIEKERVAEEGHVSGTVRKQHVEVERQEGMTTAPARATHAPGATNVRSALREGMPVLGADDEHIGTVRAVRADDFLVESRLRRPIYIPFSAVRAVTDGWIGLVVPANAVDEQGWARP